MKKRFIGVIATMFCLVAGAARAETFYFSYTFNRGDVATGSFDAEVITGGMGGVLTNIGNVDFALDGVTIFTRGEGGGSYDYITSDLSEIVFSGGDVHGDAFSFYKRAGQPIEAGLATNGGFDDYFEPMNDSFRLSPAPEPAQVAMLVAGLGILALRRKR